ncbi:hypothetical protein ACWD6U_00345 [Streptomyces sp. NPDC005149]
MPQVSGGVRPVMAGTGHKSALWVSIWPSKAGPVGLPLRAQGLRMAFARAMDQLNAAMAGQRGWKPLPRTLEQLRRSVEVEPLQEDSGV